MKKYISGLVVGKFTPIHEGNMSVIRRAAEECETVYIISYAYHRHDSKYGSDRRGEWLEEVVKIYDNVEFIIADGNYDKPKENDADYKHRDFCASLLIETFGTTVQCVYGADDYIPGFAQHLQDYFKNLFKDNAPTVDYVMLDRKVIDISGTKLRYMIKDMNADANQFLPSFVRKDLIHKVLFLGPESSGKTTLVELLGSTCNTVPEYGRTLYDERGGKLYYEDMNKIAMKQVEMEDAKARQLLMSDYLFCDTSALITEFYSMKWFGMVSDDLFYMAQESFSRYEHVYVCVPDFPMVQDGTRQDEKFRLEEFKWILDELDKNKVKYKMLIGSIEDRLNYVKSDLIRSFFGE